MVFSSGAWINQAEKPLALAVGMTDEPDPDNTGEGRESAAQSEKPPFTGVVCFCLSW